MGTASSMVMIMHRPQAQVSVTKATCCRPTPFTDASYGLVEGRFGADEAPKYALYAPDQFPKIVVAAYAKAQKAHSTRTEDGS